MPVKLSPLSRVISTMVTREEKIDRKAFIPDYDRVSMIQEGNSNPNEDLNPNGTFNPDDIFDINEDSDSVAMIMEGNSNEDLEDANYSTDHNETEHDISNRLQNSDVDQNVENLEEDANYSTDHNETEHNVPYQCESNNNSNEIFENLKKHIKLDVELNSQIVELKHFPCEYKVEIKLPQSWPKSLKSLRSYVFCKMNHFAIYERGKEKIWQIWLFYGNNFNSNLICQDPVVDNLYKYSENILFYCEIDENKYNENGCFLFADYPTTTWSYSHLEHPDYHLTKIYKKHEFDIYVCAVQEDDREFPLKWKKLDFAIEWDPENRDRHNTNEQKPIDPEQFPDHLCKLPNANDRQFLFQFATPPSDKIPAKVIEYPQVPPEGYSNETFNEKIIEFWKSNPEFFQNIVKCQLQF